MQFCRDVFFGFSAIGDDFVENENFEKEQQKKWYQKTWGIILLLFLFFPAGLYFLWKSDFSKKSKLVWTVIIGILVLYSMGRNPQHQSVDYQSQQIQQVQQVEKPKTLQQQGLEDPNATMSQKNALRKAISYATRMYMSKAGVYEQLTSEYGENFPAEDAQWAISHLSDINWKENALKKAKSYQTQQAMSAESIREQLLSEYGEKFEPEEVEYAINNLPK